MGSLAFETSERGYLKDILKEYRAESFKIESKKSQ